MDSVCVHHRNSWTIRTTEVRTLNRVEQMSEPLPPTSNTRCTVASKCEPQSKSREGLLDRCVDLSLSPGVGLAIHAVEGVGRRAVQPAREPDVEAEPQIERDGCAAPSREFRGREVVGAEHDRGARPDLVERPRA